MTYAAGQRFCGVEEKRLISPGAVRAQPGAVSVGEVILLSERLTSTDPELAAHGRMVGRYASMTAHELGVPRVTAEGLRLAGELHDIGKLEMPRRILDKPGPVDEDEWAQIRTHPVIGADLIRHVGLDQIAGWVSPTTSGPTDSAIRAPSAPAISRSRPRC